MYAILPAIERSPGSIAEELTTNTRSLRKVPGNFLPAYGRTEPVTSLS
jgi:hypothetical protein